MMIDSHAILFAMALTHRDTNSRFCRPTAYDDELVTRTVLWYLLQGGRLIDGAHLYLNHKAIGAGIREAMKRGVPREEIFVTTKVYPSHFGYNTTLKTASSFLGELGLDYVDLVLMHAPVRFPTNKPWFGECAKLGLSNKECRQETFKALSKLREQGLFRSVGVSNFATRHLKEMEELGSPIAVNQIQYNPWVSQTWLDTFDYCQQKGIQVTAYNSLGGWFQHSAARTIDALNSLSQKHDRSVAQIMLRWALQSNAAVIPGTGNPKHMAENLSIYSFELSEEDMNVIKELSSDEELQKFMVIEPFDVE